MLRPYLAIIKDSFRAAIANRVLVIMLVLITVFLAVLAPFRAIEEAPWKMYWMSHIEMPDAAISLLVENRENEKRKDLKRIWELMPEKARDEAKEYYEYDKEKIDDAGEFDPEKEGFNRLEFYKRFTEGLNTIIENEKLYDDKVFDKDKLFDAEARSLIDYGVDKLSPEQTQRLNRLLITQAFNGKIKPPSDSSLQFGYLFWDWFTIANGKVFLHEQIASWLPWVLEFFVLSIGLLISILVTAPIMPSMFEPGSLTLLMSKPIHRWALYISKFFGACAFAALLSTYLFIGLWLIFGFRLGYWDRSLLISIPLYVFVFAIYYSVSAFLGMFFRNTIVAIIGTIAFWGFCFGVGETHKSFDKVLYLKNNTGVVTSDDAIIQTTRNGLTNYWDEDSRTWKPTLITGDVVRNGNEFALGFAFPLVPKIVVPQIGSPVYNEEYQVWLNFASGIGDAQNMQNQSPLLRCSKSNQELDPHMVRGLPPYPIAFLTNGSKETLLVDARGSFWLLAQNPLDLPAAEPMGFNPRGGPVKVETGGGTNQPKGKKSDAAKPAEGPEKSKAEKPGAAKGEKQDNSSNSSQDAADDKKEENKEPLFVEVGPDKNIDVRDFRYVSLNPTNDEIAIYASRSVFVFKPDNNGKYSMDRKVGLEVEFGSTVSAWIEYRNDTIFLAFGNGQIITMDAESLTQQKLYHPETKSAIFSTSATSDGRFLSVCYRNGKVWLLDRENDSRMYKPGVGGQGTITGASFDGDDQLIICRHNDQVSWYEPDSLNRVKNIKPIKGSFKKTYFWGVRWIYAICPKPGEFYKLVGHLSSGKETQSNLNLDLTTTLEPDKPWAPFQNGLIFLICMLGFSCLVFTLTDY